jgi:hypothetical protein
MLGELLLRSSVRMWWSRGEALGLGPPRRMSCMPALTPPMMPLPSELRKPLLLPPGPPLLPGRLSAGAPAVGGLLLLPPPPPPSPGTPLPPLLLTMPPPPAAPPPGSAAAAAAAAACRRSIACRAMLAADALVAAMAMSSSRHCSTNTCTAPKKLPTLVRSSESAQL